MKKTTSLSSSIQSSHKGPYFMSSDSDDSISNIRNKAFIPKESDHIVMVSAPESDEDEEISNAPPVAGESMELDGVTVAAEANNDAVVDLESDTDIETLPVAVQNMDFDGETVAVEANNDGVTGPVVANKSAFENDEISTDTLQLLLSLKDCCPESEAESELQNLNTNFEAGGSSSRPDISTETEERTMQTENISIPEPMKDQQPTITPPSRLISSMEKNKEPMAEKNLTSRVGEDGKSDVGKKNVTESEPVDPKGKKKRFSIIDLLRQLAEEEEDHEGDNELCCLTLLEVAERRREGKF